MSTNVNKKCKKQRHYCVLCFNECTMRYELEPYFVWRPGVGHGEPVYIFDSLERALHFIDGLQVICGVGSSLITMPL